MKGNVFEPKLICKKDIILPETIEEEIKEGFYELKQKFKSSVNSSIYISHVILNQKHPLLKKVNIETLKKLLDSSKIIYLGMG